MTVQTEQNMTAVLKNTKLESLAAKFILVFFPLVTCSYFAYKHKNNTKYNKGKCYCIKDCLLKHQNKFTKKETAMAVCCELSGIFKLFMLTFGQRA